MKKILAAVAIAVALASITAAAQTVFDGTWKGVVGKINLSDRPSTFSFRPGTYECVSCDVKLKVKADGTNQRAEGNPYLDTLAVTIIDENAVEMVTRKDGREVNRLRRVVSDSGMSMTEEFKTTSPRNGEIRTGTITYKRIAGDPDGVHAVSGSWLPVAIKGHSDDVVLVTYKAEGKMMNLSASTGETYSANMDGSESLHAGDPGVTSVAVKLIGKNVLEKISRRDGKVVAVTKTTVAADGNTAIVEWEDKLNGSSGNYALVKLSGAGLPARTN